ncbi:MAG: hypothetical protein WA210_11310 [Burkholderiaceae bacterium]
MLADAPLTRPPTSAAAAPMLSPAEAVIVYPSDTVADGKRLKVVRQ